MCSLFGHSVYECDGQIYRQNCYSICCALHTVSVTLLYGNVCVVKYFLYLRPQRRAPTDRCVGGIFFGLSVCESVLLPCASVRACFLLA